METAALLINCVAFLCVIFGIYILKVDIKSRLYRVFIIICIIIALSAFSASRIYTADNKESYALWDRIGTIIEAIFFSINLHFYLLLTDRRLGKWQTLAVYIPSAIFICLEFTHLRMVTEYVQYNRSWKSVYSNTYYFYMAYSVFYAFADFILINNLRIKSVFKKQKFQARTILLFSTPLFLICAVTDYILPYFEFYKLPAFGNIGMILYAFGLWYSFVKYRFLMPQPSLLLHEIVINIQEVVILLNPELKIIIVNNKLKELLNPEKRDYTGLYLFDITEENNDIKQNIDKIISGELNSCYCTLNYKVGSEFIVTNSYIARLSDKFGDLNGILLISIENKGIKQFQKIYKITNRQMEIINLCLFGYSNMEIAEKLAVSKRTIETHLFNIYNRLGIDNKIELYNIVEKYNIISNKNWK